MLFKPTLAAVDQFRSTLDSALSYFVGQNPSFPEDNGFAIKPWSKVRWKNYGIVNNSCTMAVAMGNYWSPPQPGGRIPRSNTHLVMCAGGTMSCASWSTIRRCRLPAT